MGSRLTLHLLGAVCMSSGLAPADEGTQLILGFVDQHCIDCHDDVTSKGGLDLSSLDFAPGNRENFEKWVKIHDRVQRGEMPPEKRRQPAAVNREEFIAGLSRPLAATDIARQNAEGRVVMRRLNRTEYEYTLRELLDLPHLNVREMLPADSESHGFDTVGEALNLSYVQITKYLEAADTALGEAIQRELAERKGIRVDSETVRKTGAEIGRFKVKNGEIKHIDDTRIVLRQPNSAQTPWRLRPLWPRHDGNYIVRLSAYGIFWDGGKVKPADRPHVVSLYADSGRMRRHLHTADLSNDRAEMIEINVRLFADDNLIVSFDSLSDVNGPIKNAKDGKPYSGPGVACEWFELEGPLPEESSRDEGDRLFSGLSVVEWTPESGFVEPVRHGQPGKRQKDQHAPLMAISSNPEADARKLLLRFMERAFRRPVDPAEADIYLALVKDLLAQRIAFQDAMHTGFKAVLCSPDFLFFKESPGKLDAYALASRLSYFLWKSAPDKALLSLAENGGLDQPEKLREQTERMLNDPRSARFVEDFLDQWLELRRIGITEPDKQLYPEFTELLQHSMVSETREYFAAMLVDDLGADHLVQSSFSFLNEPLANHYGVNGVKGVEQRKVALPDDSRRGGFLTQGSILKITANGTTTSPVTRGVWIRDRLLGRPVPPPPPGAGSIDPDIRGTTTIREQLDKHRADESCASCHRMIDPPGFALESYDVIGGWRDRYRTLEIGDRVKRTVRDRSVSYRLGSQVDASGETAEGAAFKNIEDFRNLLLRDQEQLARNLTERLMIYASGAPVTFADRSDIEEILAATRENAYGLRSIIHNIVQSRPFRSK